jgi:hypothetical protein
MVEAVDRMAVEVERSDEPAEVGRPLVECDGHASLREPVRRGHPEDASTDDRDAWAGLHDGSAPDDRRRISIRQ